MSVTRTPVAGVHVISDDDVLVSRIRGSARGLGAHCTRSALGDALPALTTDRLLLVEVPEAQGVLSDIIEACEAWRGPRLLVAAFPTRMLARLATEVQAPIAMLDEVPWFLDTHFAHADALHRQRTLELLPRAS